MLSLKDKILSALQEEPVLSTEQIIRLTGAKENSVQTALRRLREKSKLIKTIQLNRRQTHLHWLKNSKEPNEITIKHESPCADLYIALKKTGIPFYWQAKDDQRKGFRFDRAFYMFDKQFYLELETGTQYYKREDVIRKKIEAYLKLEGRFHVLFSIIDGDVPAKVYSDAILEMLSDHHRGTQFLTAVHKGLLRDPLGDWLIHPDGNLLSLASIN